MSPSRRCKNLMQILKIQSIYVSSPVIISFRRSPLLYSSMVSIIRLRDLLSLLKKRSFVHVCVCCVKKSSVCSFCVVVCIHNQESGQKGLNIDHRGHRISIDSNGIPTHGQVAISKFIYSFTIYVKIHACLSCHVRWKKASGGVIED